MQTKLALALGALAALAIGVLILSQGPRQTSQQADPGLGRACFEIHRDRLPPGSQFEGAILGGDRLSVNIMTGTDIRTVDCLLRPDGNLDIEGTRRRRAELGLGD